MQARELTPEEVADGQRGINEQKFTATQVQALVRKMDHSKDKWRRLRNKPVEYERKLRDENEALYFNFPSLFQLHLEDKLDSTFFEMLNLKRKIERGELTAEQASTLVGQTLYNKFVPHVISNTAPPRPSLSYQEFYRQQSSNAQIPDSTPDE
jgi:uncharacterized short protein YbdD (DUF466 family)